MALIRVLWDQNEKYFFRFNRGIEEKVRPEPIGEPVWIIENIDREMGPNYYAEMM